MIRLYRNLARKTIEMAVRKKSISTAEASALLDALFDGRPEEPEGDPDEEGPQG